MKLAGNSERDVCAVLLDGEKDVAAGLIRKQRVPALIGWNSVDGGGSDERIQQIVECVPLPLVGKDLFNVVERMAKPITIELAADRVNQPEGLGQILQFCS